MRTIFFGGNEEVFAVQMEEAPASADVQKVSWLLDAQLIPGDRLDGIFVGPRKEMISPWSTNATEITQNSGIRGIKRIERFRQVPKDETPVFDPMLEAVYSGLDQETLVVFKQADPTRFIANIAEYNTEAGLALSADEVAYLEEVSGKLGRRLTDSEVYAFSQINSEHCRHKIFNGTFVIDGQRKSKSLFELIKETSAHAPEKLVSAYKDNVAFIKGPAILQFAPEKGDAPAAFRVRPFVTALSLKAETHNFPTTVEPFNGASTGSGGEIRDRMAGGIGSLPLAGTAVYMTAYPRLQGSTAVQWEKHSKPRNWKYQTPLQILIKASNGASDFGNKFGQPLIAGAVLTYEGQAPLGFYGFDRTVMLAGGIGYADAGHALKQKASVGDKLVLLGGDNYRIGMAGGSVSSVDTGAYSSELELSAVQRANPEMQKRVYNVIRALAESTSNPIKLIHDHGAGGHVNCFSELLDPLGGVIDLSALPLGDPTLSAKEIICNESQERMGLIVHPEDIPMLQRIADRERAPMYVVGEVVGDGRIVFAGPDGARPMDLPLEFLFGSSPKTVLEDERLYREQDNLQFSFDSGEELLKAVELVLALEGVACKDWLTNKVDRSVTGLVAQQQCVGPLQLPLSNLGVMALDYTGTKGLATAIGTAPVAGLIDARAGSVLSIAEALTNLVWAPLEGGIDGVVLSANWMWPAKQRGENARLYQAVEAARNFAVDLNLAIPTGKDSLSMTMNYDDKAVRAPGTVIISAAGECSDVKKCVTPNLKPSANSVLVALDLSGLDEFPLGGSSFAQTLGQLGAEAPTVVDPESFKRGLKFIQALVSAEEILAGHDISSGGLVTSALEMAFAGNQGIELSINGSPLDVPAKLFCEKPGVLLQVEAGKAREITVKAQHLGLQAEIVGQVKGTQIRLHAGPLSFSAALADLRRKWFKPSYLLDSKQTTPRLAKERLEHFDAHPLEFHFPDAFTGKAADYGVDLARIKTTGIKAAVIRDKGTNGDREMALSLFAVGFDVRDVTVSDLMTGRESLEDLNFIVFPGGFSNSDVLGAGRGWAGVMKYNERAMASVRRYYSRPDTLSLGVCNGCQLVTELELLYPEHERKIRMRRNESHKFESCFVNVKIRNTNSVMLAPLAGAQLGIWVAHGEGRFELPEGESSYDIPLRYISADYPANPNGSAFNAAGVCSLDGRHLIMMPHLERSIFSWQWPYRAALSFEVSPWIAAFAAARDWIKEHR